MKRITEKQLRNLVAESVRRCLNEGTTDSHVTEKWEEVQEYAGAEQMLDDIFCFLSGDQIEDLTRTLCDNYEINFDDDEEEFDGDFEEFDEGRKRRAKRRNGKRNICESTARDFLDIELEDDGKETGGISFIGETLRDFLDDAGMSYDTPMDVVNKELDECGIEPIQF